MSKIVPRIVNDTGYRFKTVPYDHQMVPFKLARDREYFGYLMGPGTGKTKVTLDAACWNYLQGNIDRLLVVAPNGVHREWVLSQIPKHVPDEINVNAVFHRTSGSGAAAYACQLETLGNPKDGRFDILTMNVEAFGASATAMRIAEEFLRGGRSGLVVDESTRIKNPKAKRTEVLEYLKTFSYFRRILTGTPATESPFDLYSQFNFLDPTILGFSSFYSFSHYFGLWHKQKRPGTAGKSRRDFYEVLDMYDNLEELKRLISPHCYRVTTEECVDLPPVSYRTIPVEMTSKQAQYYKSMADELMVEFDAGFDITALNVLTKFVRLQQILSGFLEHPETKELLWLDKENPRLDALTSLLEDVTGKNIIWAHFTNDVETIYRTLQEKYGPESVVHYYGKTKDDERTRALRAIQDPSSPVKYFVGNPLSGGIGLDITEPDNVFYYSNNWSLENRIQSEARTNRIGRMRPTNYFDFSTVGTIDELLAEALQSKLSLSTYMSDVGIQKFLRGQK